MCVKPIHNLQDFHQAINKASLIADDTWPRVIFSEKGSQEMDEFDVLAILIEGYEREKWPRDFSDPIEAIQYYMKQKGLTLLDLAVHVGTPDLALEILEKRRPLSFPMIWKICRAWKIPAISLLKPYKLSLYSQTLPPRSPVH